MSDRTHMRDALALAAKAVGNTSPNPMVGAVVVGTDGSVAGAGFHERAGTSHAEAVALERAGMRAKGGTLYVTLEPCHREGRTPPCTRAIIAAGIARVVVAMVDPDPRERGAGIQELRDAGVEVEVGTGEDDARHLNRFYACHRIRERPFVTLKMAQTLDGAIGERPGERRALTGAKADRHVHTLRFQHDAVVVGVETVIVDDPLLTVRPYRRRAVPYVRIIVDSTARLPLTSNVVRDRARASTVVAVTDAAPADRVTALEAAGVRTLHCEQDPAGRVLLPDLLRRLGAEGTIGVLCEGGPRLAGALLDDEVVDEIHWLVTPLIFGTAAVAPVVAGARKSHRLKVAQVKRLGDDVLIVAAPRHGVDEGG